MATTKKAKSRAASARARARAKLQGDEAAPETKAKPKRKAASKATGKAKAKPKRKAAGKAASKAPDTAAVRKRSVRTSAAAMSGKGVAAAPEEKRTSPTGYLSKYPYPARMAMTISKSAKKPSTPVEHVAHAAKAILLSSGEGFVRRGQLQLYLATVTKATKTTEEARQWVADAFEAGVLKPYTGK